MSIGAWIDEDNFLGVAIDGLSDSWGTFVSSVCGRAEPSSFERLWHDYMEEENRLQWRSGSSSEKVGEKDLALAAKFKKGKRLKGKKTQKHGDHPNIKCFRCDQYGHYTRDCKKPPT